jgi:hypothetical protein
MKKIYLLALTSVFALTGCNDFLDSENYTGKDSRNFPTSEQDVTQMVSAVYAASSIVRCWVMTYRPISILPIWPQMIS